MTTYDRPSPRHRRGALVVVAGWVLAALILGGTAGAQEGGQQLTITGVTTSGEGGAVVVRAPDGTPVPAADAGRVLVDGRELSTRTAPLAGTSPVLLVVDASTPSELFRPLQGALIELVRRLPADTPVVVADSGSGAAVPAGLDRTTAGEAIAAITSSPEGDLGTALEAARAAADAGDPVAVLVAAAPGRVPEAVDADPARPVWVAVLTPDAPTAGPAVDLAVSSGTDVVASADPVGILPALGGIAADLGNRYVLTTDEPLEGELLEVQLPGVSGTLVASTPLGDVAEGGPGAGGAAAAEDDGGLPTWLVVLAIAVGVAVLIGLVALLVRSLRSRSTSAPAPVPAMAPPPADRPAGLPAPSVAGAALFGAATNGSSGHPAPGAPVAPAPPLFGPEAAAPPPPAVLPPPTGTPLFGPGAPAGPDAADAPAPWSPNRGEVPGEGTVEDETLPTSSLPGEPAPEPHVFSVDPQPIDLRRPTTPTVDAGLGIAERDAVEALAELSALRAEAAPSVPADLYLALEAAASQWLVDETAGPEDVVRCLSPQGPPDGPVAGHLWALRRCLTLPESTGGRDAADRAVEVLRSPSPAHVVRLPPPPPPAGHAPTLQGLVTEAALIERVERYGRLGPDAARTVLATGPARTGMVDGVPLVLSPSLVRGEDDQPGAAEPLGARSLEMLLSVTDAAGRMIDAERALRHALPEVGSRGRAVAEGTRFDAEVVAALVAGQVVLTPASVAARVADPGAAAELIDVLVGAGLLRQDSTAADGTPLWVVPLLFDQVTAPFAEPGLVTERAVESRRRTTEGSNQDAELGTAQA